MTVSNSDRKDALEPLYTMTGWAGSSSSLRTGVRNRDSLAVVIKILVNHGTEASEQAVHRYFKALMGKDEIIIDILTRGDDLYLIYRSVGQYDGTSLLAVSLTPESFIRRVKLAQQAMNHWHQYGVAHGALTLSKFRFSKNWKKAWLTDPDLRFLQESTFQPNVFHDYRNFTKIFHKILKFIVDPEGIATRFLLNLKPQIAIPHSKHDQKSEFNWPSEIYGRNNFCEELRNTLITTSKQRIIVIGVPGIGKTSLLEALNHELQVEEAWVVTTRFTRDSDSTAAVAEAFESIAEQILFSEPLLARRKAIQLRKAVGYAASLVAKISPSFAVLWHETGDKGAADKHANPKKILRLALARLLKHIAENHQLILLVEDAHLAGRSGKKLLRGIELEQISLNIVGFARPAEQLAVFKHFKTIHLAGIPREAVANLLYQITGILPKDLKLLVDKLYLQFNGNPLLLRMAISALIEKKALWKNSNGIWQYDIDTVEPVLLGMQPGELIQARLALFEDPKQIFTVLALLDPPFSLSLAAAATGLSKDAIIRFFRRAISAQLLKESGDAIIHDSVRQTLLENLTKEVRAEIYWQIGQRLFALATEYEETAKYLAKGMRYAESHSLKIEEVIPCILTSLEKALNLGFREDAELYCQVISLALRSENIPAELEVKARVCLARVNVVARNYENAQQILATTATSIGLQARVAIIAEQVHLYTLLGNSDRALTTGLQSLEELDINLSKGSAALQEVEELLEKMQQLLEKRVEFKRATTDFAHALQQLLASLLPLTYVNRADLFPGVVSQLVKQTIEQGITPDSVRGLTTLGQLACVSFNNAKLGMMLGRLAERIAAKPGLTRYLSIVCSDLANFILPWSGNLLEVNAMNRKGMVAADELGEVQYSGYIRMHDVINRFAGGDRLPGLLKRVNGYINEVRRDKNALAIAMLEEASIGLKAVLSAEPMDHNHEDKDDTTPLTLLIHGLVRAFDLLLRENLHQADVHLHHAERNLHAADGWLAPKILYIQLKSLFIVRSSEDSKIIYDMLAELEQLQLTTQTLQPVGDYLRCLLAIKKENTWDAIRFAELMLEEAESLGYRALAALCAEETSRFLAMQERESLSVSFQRRAAKFYHDWGLRWKAGRLGYGLESKGTARSSHFLGNLTDWRPGLSSQAAITQIMIWLRERVGASRVILASYKQGVMELALQLKEAEETVQPNHGDISTLPKAMVKLLNKAINTGKQASTKFMTAIPLALGAKRFAVAVDGVPHDFLKTALTNGAERIVAAALLDYVQRHETPSVRSLLQLLMSHLGDFYFFVDVEGNGIDLDGQKFPIPKKLRIASENVESTGTAEIINELWTPPATDAGYYRFSGLPTGSIEWLNWDVACVLWVAKDMTSERLFAKNEAAIEEVELVKRLAAGLNHDMNNYLTAISGYVEMQAFKGKLDLSEGSLREAVEGLRAISQRFYHLSQGQVSHIKLKSVDLVPIVNGAGRYLKWLVPDNCTFEIIVPDHPVFTRADLGAIDRILLNLVTNAKQALGDHGNYICIRLIDGEHPMVQVEDNGSGIAAEQLESIFQPGFSGKGSSGLGLHIVKTEAKAMNAKVSVRSTPGIGTVLCIRFVSSAAPKSID